MKYVVSRDPLLSSRLLFPSLSYQALPGPVEGRVTTYHFWARNALFHGLGVLGVKRGDKVLVPAFHCRTVVDPILQFGCEVVFYNVHRDGTVDFEDLTQKVDQHTKAIIAIHYFGVPQAVHRLRKVCQQYHLSLIEDCAHILIGEINGGQIGSFGDVSIFSWRKFFPVFDGGLLVMNEAFSQAVDIPWKKIDGWFQVKIMKNLIEKFLHDMTRKKKQVLVVEDQTSQIPVSTSNRKEEAHGPVSPKTPVGEFDLSQVNWPMSRWSKSIIKNNNILSVAQRRMEHSRVLWKEIGSLPDVQPWATAEQPNVSAWAFPFVTPNRQDVHVKLREKGIQAFTWGGVIHPTLPLENFPDAKFLYEHLVLLPNQQSLTQHEMALMIDGVKGVLKERASVQQTVSR